MANNRLYIKHKETGEEFMLAKCLASGWYLNAETDEERLAFVNRLEKFLEEADTTGGYGGTTSDLVIITENDEGYESYQEPQEK